MIRQVGKTAWMFATGYNVWLLPPLICISILLPQPHLLLIPHACAGV